MPPPRDLECLYKLSQIFSITGEIVIFYDCKSYARAMALESHILLIFCKEILYIVVFLFRKPFDSHPGLSAAPC